MTEEPKKPKRVVSLLPKNPTDEEIDRFLAILNGYEPTTRDRLHEREG